MKDTRESRAPKRARETKPQSEPQTFNLFDLDSIEIPLTYDFLADLGAMIFFCRPLLINEEREARQAFYALPLEDRKAKQHEYNVELLASLCTKLPVNVPTFPADAMDVKKAIVDFFTGENPMKKKVVEDALTIYFAKTQPLEFFR